jgi:hypothetical protein
MTEMPNFSSSGRKRGSPFGRHFDEFKIQDADAIKCLRISARMLADDRWMSNATLRIKELHVSLQDTDAKGIYPSKISVLRLGEYRRCGPR